MCFMVNMAMLFMFLMGSGLSYELPGPGILRSLNKNVTGSSQHPEIDKFALSFAVDGSTSRNSSSCKCCAATQLQDNPWIQIDLGRLYRVATVEVIGRTDYNDSFNMAINVSATNTISQGSTPTQESRSDKTYHNVTFIYPVIGQFVTLQLNGNVLLCVCEVNIYSKDCSNGTYGLYCNETCGQCQDGQTCDIVTGRCTRCLPGYQLPLCTEGCSSGRFGANCSFRCHCLDNQTCDPATGGCPEGKCASGWEGITCSNTLISLNANVSASSIHTHPMYALSRAVDGNTRTDSNNCACCAATDREDQPWIQIDLGRLYRVAKVEVVSRTDWASITYFAGMRIYIHENRDHWTVNHALVRTVPNDGSRYYNTTFDNPVIAQYVTLQIPVNDNVLVVCEVSVFSSYCSNGTYGLYCNETCGQCQNEETCDNVTGNCGQCLPGYQSPLCTKECLHRSFGPNCSSTCHCQGNGTCDHVNGSCPNGLCELGWRGLNCSQNTLISLNANVSASSIHTHPKFALSRAVDGNTRTDSDNCACCAATDKEDEPWIQIDLGRLYRVAKVEVFSRTDWASITYFAGMRIFLHENRDHWTVNHALVRTVPNDGSRYYTTTFDNPVIAQYVTLQIPVNDNVLVVCEVSVFSSYCRNGTYGLYCNETCGQCQNGETCDNVTGNCEQCLPGYQFPLCTKQCPPGRFGHDCASGCNCQKDQTCHHVTGECPDHICDVGWMGLNCSTECDHMTYGNNCAEECGNCYKESCDRRTGNCSPCFDGYTGPRCTEGIIRLSAEAGMQVSMSSVHAGMDATKAVDGQLVDDPETCGCCSETTNEYSSWWQVDLGRPFFLKKVFLYGRLNENVFRQLVGFSILISLTDEFPESPVHNQNGEIQDSKVVVLLSDVAARYVRIQRLGILTICEVELVQSDIICPTYTYGRSCAACGPCRNGSCDRVTGVCPSGCYDGYEGNMCEKLRVHKSTDNDVINGVIGAGVGVMTSLLVAALIVALFLCKKRRIRIYEEPTVRWAKEPTKESAYATLENQEIVIEKEKTYDNPM